MSIRERCQRLLYHVRVHHVRGRRLAVGLLGGTVVAVLAVTGSAATAQPVPDAAGAVQPADVPAPPPGFTTTWSDDFTGAAGSALDTGSWRYDTGPGSNFGTGEIETMTNSTDNVFLDGNGHLVLRALHQGTDPRAGWTSGRIETQADGFGAEAGGVVRMQASIQQPDVTTDNGAGYWPAFWMLGTPLRAGVPWPTSGEVDILEDINGRSSVFGTLHCGTNPGGPCNESSGIGSGERPCPGCQTDFHTYAVEIDRSSSPEQIRWYLDGTNYFTLNSTAVDATTWSNAVDHAFFIIFDLAMGGGFPDAFGGGPNSSTISGGQLKVDYVAVYNKSAGGSADNLALGKDTTASSVESDSFPASNATDGDATTRWSSAFSDPQWLQVDLGQTYAIDRVRISWEAAYASAYQIQVSNDGTTWSTAYTNNASTGGIQDLAVAGSGRYVRVFATKRATQWGDSIYELGVFGSASNATANAALGRPTTASSQESSAFPASNATDGDPGTRWSSAFSDPQWVRVDLGSGYDITRVTLRWESAYASAYQIQVSDDGSSWSTIYTDNSSTGGTQNLAVTGSGRYVRVYATARATQWGDSLWEFEVYGSAA